MVSSLLLIVLVPDGWCLYDCIAVGLDKSSYAFSLGSFYWGRVADSLNICFKFTLKFVQKTIPKSSFIKFLRYLSKYESESI